MKISKPPKLPRPGRRQSKRKAELDAPISQRLEFKSYEPRLLMSAVLLPVHGTLNQPGQIDQYTFSLSTPTQVYFDSQTPNSQIDWTLTGATGTLVNARPFNQSN